MPPKAPLHSKIVSFKLQMLVKLKIEESIAKLWNNTAYFSKKKKSNSVYSQKPNNLIGFNLLVFLLSLLNNICNPIMKRQYLWNNNNKKALCCNLFFLCSNSIIMVADIVIYLEFFWNWWLFLFLYLLVKVIDKWIPLCLCF